MKKTHPKQTARGAGKKTKDARHRPEHAEDLLTHPLLHGGLAAHAAGAHASKREGLGDRVRKAREMRGLTVEDLASRTGIGAGAIQRVEAGETIPPLGELIRLAKALAMQMGHLISPGVEKQMTVVRAGSRLTVSRHGKKAAEQYGYEYQSLAHQKADRRMEPFLVTLLPTDFDLLSAHDGQEFIFVLEGEVRARVGDESERLHPGDAMYYDSTSPHLVKCAGAKPARILAVLYAGSKQEA